MCFEKDPNKRPTAKQVLAALTGAPRPVTPNPSAVANQDANTITLPGKPTSPSVPNSPTVDILSPAELGHSRNAAATTTQAQSGAGGLFAPPTAPPASQSTITPATSLFAPAKASSTGGGLFGTAVAETASAAAAAAAAGAGAGSGSGSLLGRGASTGSLFGSGAVAPAYIPFLGTETLFGTYTTLSSMTSTSALPSTSGGALFAGATFGSVSGPPLSSLFGASSTGAGGLSSVNNAGAATTGLSSFAHTLPQTEDSIFGSSSGTAAGTTSGGSIFGTSASTGGSLFGGGAFGQRTTSGATQSSIFSHPRQPQAPSGSANPFGQPPPRDAFGGELTQAQMSSSGSAGHTLFGFPPDVLMPAPKQRRKKVRVKRPQKG
mmetsp:Transcript_25226/g.72840  ORF Transcript_25226/g.72840 Transcript_25226/m.72840 type:complete len:377 (+) Transcript_25226:200-1330(+)